MSLVRRSASHDLMTFPSDILSMQREINSLFNTFFRGTAEDSGVMSPTWYPAADITEHEDTFEVKMELPGVSRDDVKITLQDTMLTITGEKKLEKESKGTDYHRTERSYGSFERSFSLPSLVKADDIAATFSDGVLTITLPKAEETRRKEIPVKVK